MMSVTFPPLGEGDGGGGGGSAREGKAVYKYKTCVLQDHAQSATK